MVQMEVKLIDSMGSDLSVVNAARVSFAKQKEVMDESDEKPPVDFKVVHHYFLIKKNVVYPMSFIKNKWFK